MAVGDLNGDGKRDAVTGGNRYVAPRTYAVRVRITDRGGTTTAVQSRITVDKQALRAG